MQAIEIPIDDIKLDLNNPRIKKALEKYGESEITDERIFFALQTQSESAESPTSTFNKLKESIRASDGINSPISVVKKNGHYVCIDGNTRVMIYKDFRDKGFKGSWNTIPAFIIDEEDVEKVRITSHIVGPREWPAFEKAQYLYGLYKDDRYSFGQIANICGGNTREIEGIINAYEDMIENYTAQPFDITRFSGFVELQKPKIKESIISAGYEMKDFGDWIREGWIKRLADVRKIPKVFGNPEAKEIFLKGGIDSMGKAIDATKIIPKQAGNLDLSKLSVSELASLMAEKVKNLTRGEMDDIRQNVRESIDSDIVANLNDLQSDLLRLIKEIEDE